MADDIGGVWRTVGGRRIFIKDGEDLKEAMAKSGKFLKNKKDSMSIYGKSVKNEIKNLESDKYSDGTYDIITKQSVEFKDGFQATFQQLGDKYNDEQFGELVKKYSDATDGKVYAGKFGGSPEVSFHFKTEKEAIEICKKYNQVSYWDWNKASKDPTYTGTKNKFYKKGKGNDYE